MATDKYTSTPLCRAAASGHRTVVARLIEAGADVNAADSHGVTPLMWAGRHCHLAIVNQLLNISSIDRVDADGCNILHHLCACGNVKLRDRVAYITTVWKALSLGADARAKDVNGDTPRHKLVASKVSGVVATMLLHKGALCVRNHAGMRAAISNAGVSVLVATVLLQPHLLSNLLRTRDWFDSICFKRSRMPPNLAPRALAEYYFTRQEVSWIEAAGIIHYNESAAEQLQQAQNTLSIASKEWAPTRHGLFGPRFRRRVFLLMLVHARLMRVRRLPAVPLEVWLHIISFISRREFVDKSFRSVRSTWPNYEQLFYPFVKSSN